VIGAGFAAKVLSIITGPFVEKITGSITELAKLYVTKQISEAEFKSRTAIAVEENFREVEKAWADAATKQFESFQQTARSTPVVARAYAAVIVTQLFVLVWYQWGASAFLLITGQAWPSAGATVDWAYAILALCLGGGAFVFRGSRNGK
jgi:hypothetical protein